MKRPTMDMAKIPYYEDKELYKEKGYILLEDPKDCDHAIEEECTCLVIVQSGSIRGYWTRMYGWFSTG